MPQFDFTITLETERSLSFQYSDHLGVRERDGKLIPDPIAQFTVKRMNDWINVGLLIKEMNDRDALDPDDLKAIGLNLYRILFGDPQLEIRFRDLYNDFAKSRRSSDSRMRLRLVFSKETAQLGELPWEFLYIPDRTTGDDAGGRGSGKDWMSGFFFGEREELLLTRFAPAEAAEEPFEIGDQPLTILLATYTDFPKMNVIRPAEIALVESQMKLIPGAKVDAKRNIPWSELWEYLRLKKPHIFHFIGHGDAGRLSFIKSYGEEDYDEQHANEVQVQWREAQDFRRLCEYPGSPRLVFLQACNGSATPTNSLGCAQELIKARIPAVIAMQHSIRAYDASTFAAAFYGNLGRGASVDEAVRVGRQKLGQLQTPGWRHPRFGTPVVYLRTDDKLVNLESLTAKKELVQPEPLTGTLHVPGPVLSAPVSAPKTPAAGEPSDQASRFEPGR